MNIATVQNIWNFREHFLIKICQSGIFGVWHLCCVGGKRIIRNDLFLLGFRIAFLGLRHAQKGDAGM